MIKYVIETIKMKNRDFYVIDYLEIYRKKEVENVSFLNL